MGVKDWLLRTGSWNPGVSLTGYYADIQRWEDIYNGGGDWRSEEHTSELQSPR